LAGCTKNNLATLYCTLLQCSAPTSATYYKTSYFALDIASASGTEDPGSNPARVLGNISMILCVHNWRKTHCVCAYLRNKGIG
jgi:hypothetical protein